MFLVEEHREFVCLHFLLDYDPYCKKLCCHFDGDYLLDGKPDIEITRQQLMLKFYDSVVLSVGQKLNFFLLRTLERIRWIDNSRNWTERKYA